MLKTKQQFMTKEEVLRMRSSTIEEAVYIVNEVLSRVYNKAVEDTLRQTPDLMLRLFVSQQAQNKLVTDFYESNPDFKGHRDIVQSIIQKVEASNPGKTFEFILSLSEPMIRDKISKLALLKELAYDKPEEVNKDGTKAL
jgi:hypothetical protein